MKMFRSLSLSGLGLFAVMACSGNTQKGQFAQYFEKKEAQISSSGADLQGETASNGPVINLPDSNQYPGDTDGGTDTGGTTPDECKVTQNSEGIEVRCGDTTGVVKNGKDGVNSLVKVERMTDLIDEEVCPSKAGTLVLSGLDDDGDKLLDDEEVDAQAFVCDGTAGEDGKQCSVEEKPEAGGIEITCGDKTQLVLHGKDGKDGKDGVNGKDGKDGKDGYSSLIITRRFACDNGICASGKGILVFTGSDLNRNKILEESEVTSISYVCDGLDGQAGKDGKDGQGCTVTDLPQLKAVKITCGSTYQLVYHGKDGKNGLDGLHAMVDTFRFNCDNKICSSGRGAYFKSGVDANRNGMLDAGEVKSSSFVCDGMNGTDGKSCKVEELSDKSGIKLTCGDKTQIVYHGKDGMNGKDGKDGKSGYNSLIDSKRFSCNTSLCASGSGTHLRYGYDKNSNNVLEAGEEYGSSFVCDGINGGTDARSCSIKNRPDVKGIEITCGSSSQILYHGKDGQDGQDGTNGTNGTNGKDGLNALVKMQRFTSRKDLCAATGNGVEILAGLDKNKDNVLADSEITDRSAVCDGNPGHNALVHTHRFACGPSCPSSRGAIISTGLDLNSNNVLDQNEVKSSSFVCDGN